MKILKIFFTSLLALSLIVLTGVFILLEVVDADQYLPQVTNRISASLGRPVIVGHMGLGVSLHGITLDAEPLVIADDPAFTSQPFIKIDKVSIGVDLESLILQHKMRVTGVFLQSPQIHFIRDQQGNINISSLGLLRQSSKNDPAVVDTSSGVIVPSAVLPTAPQNEADLEAKLKELGVLTVQGASISFIDQDPSMPLDLWLSNINLSTSNFSLSRPFGLSLSACFYSNDPNVHGSLLVSGDLSKRSIQISDLSLNVDLAKVNTDSFKGASPYFLDKSSFKNVSGDVKLNIADLGIDRTGIQKANGELLITGGVIKDFNIIKSLLSQMLGAFGGMEGNIESFLNGQLKDKLGAEDTIIEKATAKFSIHDKSFFIDDSLIQTNIFELTAQGSVDQALDVDMQTMLHLNSDVSADLVNGLGGLKYLMDGSKRIAVGASLKGVIPHLKYKPNKDFKKKSKRALIAEGGNILNILFK